MKVVCIDNKEDVTFWFSGGYAQTPNKEDVCLVIGESVCPCGCGEPTYQLKGYNAEHYMQKHFSPTKPKQERKKLTNKVTQHLTKEAEEMLRLPEIEKIKVYE